MRIGATLLVAVILLGCAPATGAPASSAPATLTPLNLSTEPPWHMKSAGVVTSISDHSLVVRVDHGTLNLQESLNGALIALRTDERTAFALNAKSFADVHVGDHVTFAFDPRTLDSRLRSYLATVVGRQ